MFRQYGPTCSLSYALSRTETPPQFRSLFLPPTLARSDLRTVGSQLLPLELQKLPDPGRVKRVMVDSLVMLTTNAVTFQMIPQVTFSRGRHWE
jgi:hypothetical protein